MQKYAAAIFLDNDQGNIDAFESALPTIRCIKVAESPGRYPRSDITDPASDVAKYTAKSGLENNFYVKFMKHTKNHVENYDPLSGIDAGVIGQLETWISETAGGPRAAIFDWDRTITKMEGVLIPVSYAAESLVTYFTQKHPTIIDDSDIIEDYCIFLCGGHERLALIRGMFDSCKAADIDIVILSNSASCSRSKYYFEELINNIVRPAKPITFICSHLYGGDKVAALMSDDRFSDFAVQDGGRRLRRLQSRRQSRRLQSRRLQSQSLSRKTRRRLTRR